MHLPHLNRSFRTAFQVLQLRVRAIRESFDRKFAPLSDSPIIVLGNQKAGTSVVANLIADYGGLSRTIDIPESFSPTIESLLRGDLSLSTFADLNRHRFSKSLIKEPNFTFLHPQLRSLFPRAQFVFVVRDPRDNIRSLLNRVGIPGDREHLDPHDWDLPRGWRHIFNGELWNLPATHYVELLAWRWRRAAEIYLEQRGTFHLIRYEDFLDEKGESISSLSRTLGLCRRSNIEHKLNLQYQPEGDRNIGWHEFFRAPNLYRIERICETPMRRLGYEPIL